MNIKAVVAAICVFLGCCSNVVFLELLIKYDPGSGNLVTFSQFLFVALEGLVFTSKFGRNSPRIGLKDYSKLVLMFFLTSVCNNYAFDFNIPMPLHMIFRAGSLIANMIMGIIILKKRYELSKYISVFMITAGIVMCTIISGKNVEKSSSIVPQRTQEENKLSIFFWWIVGISLLTVALLISAYMGICQEVLYKRFGKHPRESLFYTHILPLPGFLIMYQNIWDHFIMASNSEPINISFGVNFQVPVIVFYLICNVLTQYVCISSVYVLTSECTSLTVTLIVTLRKFVSLIFSILYFNNKFTFTHWIGTILVFTGTIIFTELFQRNVQSYKIHKLQSQKPKVQ